MTRADLRTDHFSMFEMICQNLRANENTQDASQSCAQPSIRFKFDTCQSSDSSIENFRAASRRNPPRLVEHQSWSPPQTLTVHPSNHSNVAQYAIHGVSGFKWCFWASVSLWIRNPSIGVQESYGMCSFWGSSLAGKDSSHIKELS